jgi:hypothetical protein
MKLFRDFLKGFKPKYRTVYNRALDIPTKAFANPADAEVVLYETYLRQMRQTGETSLNLDIVNLLAYTPSKKLHAQLVKYPQEVVPVMDQVLKDLMLEIAEMDQREGLDGMQGGQGDEEIVDIMNKVFTIRPFGLPSINMRELNPAGKVFSIGFDSAIHSLFRYRQTGRNQRSRHSFYTNHPRHEDRLFPMPYLFAYYPSRDRPGKNHRTDCMSARRMCRPWNPLPHPQSLHVCRPSSDSPARDARRCP